MSIYILIDDDRNGKFKIGRTSGTPDQLLSQYLRAVPRARFKLFRECPNSTKIEAKIKDSLRKYRQINTNGGVSEWVENISEETLLDTVNKIIDEATAQEKPASDKLPTPPVHIVDAASVAARVAKFAAADPATFGRLCAQNIGINNVAVLADFPQTAAYLADNILFSDVSAAAAFIGGANYNIIHFPVGDVYCVTGGTDLDVYARIISYVKNVHEFQRPVQLTKVSKGFDFYFICDKPELVGQICDLAAVFFSAKVRLVGKQIVTSAEVTGDADYTAKFGNFAAFLMQRLNLSDTVISAAPIVVVCGVIYYKYELSPRAQYEFNVRATLVSQKTFLGDEYNEIVINPPKSGQSFSEYAEEIGRTWTLVLNLLELGYKLKKIDDTKNYYFV